MNVATFSKYVQRHGVLRTVRHYSLRLLRRLVDFEVLRVEAASEASPTGSSTVAGYVTRTVTAAEYAAGVEALAGDHDRPWAFDRRDICLGTFFGDALVGYNFYSHDRTIHKPGLDFRFPDGFTYLFAVFTDPAHRGRQLVTARANKRREIDQLQGVSRRVLGIIAVDNDASRAAYRHLTEERIGYVAYVKIRSRYHCFASPACKCAGIGFVDTAWSAQHQ